MNAISQNPPENDPAACTARHRRMLQEIAEIGMNLLRLAARKAEAQLATAGPQDAALDFARLARMIQQTIALEARLSGNASPAQAAPRPAETAPTKTALSDPRRAPLRRGLHIATDNQPDRAALRRQADTLINQHLAADPEQTTPVYDLLVTICHELKVKLDLARMPDECIGYTYEPPPEKTDNAQPEIDVLSDDFFSYLRTGSPNPFKPS